MEFERARTKEQKNVRISEIVEAAIHQYDKMPYEKITLASISKELSFSRVNLYKYFKTKDEIFLKVIELDLFKFVDRLKLVFVGQPSKDIDTFARKWSSALYSQSRMIELMSKLFGEIEKNSSVEKLAEFKQSYFSLFDDLYEILNEQLPMLDNDKIYDMMMSHFMYALGLFPTTKLSENQRKAIESVGMEYTPPNFIEASCKFIVIYIKGLLAE